MKPWEIPDPESVVAYLKMLSSEELTEWCLERLERPPYGPPAGATAGSCRRGHPRTPENVYYRKDGSRSCQECQREANRRYEARRRRR
jgi:hypothetical protein